MAQTRWSGSRTKHNQPINLEGKPATCVETHIPRNPTRFRYGKMAVMDLGLRGKSLQSALFEHTVRMQLSDVYFIVIESPFRLDIHGDSFSLSPEEESDDDLQALRELVGHTIEEDTADAAGALHVIFEGGARLTVEPDAAYEAWSVSGPDGALVVSTAGGKLAIWKSQLNADESAETSPDR